MLVYDKVSFRIGEGVGRKSETQRSGISKRRAPAIAPVSWWPTTRSAPARSATVNLHEKEEKSPEAQSFDPDSGPHIFIRVILTEKGK